MRAAIVRDGIVENIIIAGDGFDPGKGLQLVPLGYEPVDIGAAYDGKVFIKPDPEPEMSEPDPEVSRRDQLLAAGFTEAQADAILALD